MIGILDYATSGDHGSLWSGVGEFAISMAVGLAVGVVGALILMTLMRSVSLPGEGLYPIRTLVFAFVDLRRRHDRARLRLPRRLRRRAC